MREREAFCHKHSSLDLLTMCSSERGKPLLFLNVRWLALECREQNANAIGRSEFGGSGRSENFKLSSGSNLSHGKVSSADWWAEDLAVLRIDFYQRVLAAMRTKGLRVESIGGALMHFAQRSLKGFNRKQNGRSDMKPPKMKVPLRNILFQLDNG